MDPFAVIALGALAGLALAVGLVVRPTGARAVAPAEPDDLDDLLEAVNSRRRRRGAAELTADGAPLDGA